MRIIIMVFVVALSATGCMRSPEAPAASAPEAASPPTPRPASVDEQAAAVAPRLKVIGTEPFWGIDVDGGRLHYTTMEDQAGRSLEAEPQAAGDGRWQWAGDDDGGKFVLDIAPGECSDGMSDRLYAYTANFNIGQAEYRGCADDPAKFSGEGQ